MVDEFIHRIPKAELHIHIEGSLEPELMFKLANKNRIILPYSTVEAVRKAYKFTNLQSFLDIYYQGASVLIDEQDFYDLAWAYFEKASNQNIRHTEIFFDPQTHTNRGIAFGTVVNGLHRAQEDARHKFNISSGLILCFLRHLDTDSAFKTLEEARPYKPWILGVGLDSSELGNPPLKFKQVFEQAIASGYLPVAHAGEEGPAEYVWQAVEGLHARRIDHGVHSTEDPRLVERLVQEQIPLTVCPLSNVKLRVFNTLADHNLKKMLDRGLCVTVNSDDPAYFGGYLEDNLQAARDALELKEEDIYRLMKNSFQAAFIDQEKKSRLIEELDNFMWESASRLDKMAPLK
ncbi:MAG: adenosine deaminase [Chloroflexi bacterium]|nr:adenosine deaminase [Chloroflexota bacterium]